MRVAARCALAAACLLPAAAARGEVLIFVCRNPASGATWSITVDPDRGTADAYPATITAARIAWHDPAQGGYYELDRATGALTVRQASSTGGYFLHDRCRRRS